MALTDADSVKEFLGIASDAQDEVIASVVDAVSLSIARYCHRVDARTGASLLERNADRVEYPEGGGSAIQLGCAVIETITEIKQAADRDFEAAEALVEGTDFWIETEACAKVHNLLGPWLPGRGMVYVKYTGGFYTGDLEEVPEDSIAVPADLKQAATLQAVHEFQHRTRFGERQISMGTMSISQVVDGMLDIVKEKLAPYVRMA